MNKVYPKFLFCSVGILFTWLIYDYSLNSKNFVQEDKSFSKESFQKTEENVEEIPLIETIDIEKRAYEVGFNKEKRAYEVGFNKGQNALYMQMGKAEKIKDKQSEYTVLIEENEETKEIQQKGYADGYHKASESFSCPRSF